MWKLQRLTPEKPQTRQNELQLWDPDMIKRRELLHFKIEFLRLGFTFSKLSLWDSRSMCKSHGACPRGNRVTFTFSKPSLWDSRSMKTRFPRGQATWDLATSKCLKSHGACPHGNRVSLRLDFHVDMPRVIWPDQNRKLSLKDSILRPKIEPLRLEMLVSYNVYKRSLLTIYLRF